MRLIDAPIGIFRFNGELVLKTEYHSENKQSGKYIPDCYIVRTGEYFWGGAKTANELNNLDVEPVDFAELLPSAQFKQRWIPCSEDFPKAKQKVLVQYADGSMATKRCNDEGHLQWFYANAVAWMPAPEPYKGENNESN